MNLVFCLWIHIAFLVELQVSRGLRKEADRDAVTRRSGMIEGKLSLTRMPKALGKRHSTLGISELHAEKLLDVNPDKRGKHCYLPER